MSDGCDPCRTENEKAVFWMRAFAGLMKLVCLPQIDIVINEDDKVDPTYDPLTGAWRFNRLTPPGTKRGA